MQIPEMLPLHHCWLGHGPASTSAASLDMLAAAGECSMGGRMAARSKRRQPCALHDAKMLRQGAKILWRWCACQSRHANKCSIDHIIAESRGRNTTKRLRRQRQLSAFFHTCYALSKQHPVLEHLDGNPDWLDVAQQLPGLLELISSNHNDKPQDT